MSAQPFPPGMEDETGIFFSSEDIDFKLKNERRVRKWLQQVIEQAGNSLRLLNFIFCSDEHLHRLNVEYLDHDTLTDILTFPYAEPPLIEGDIYISIERVRENAAEFQTTFERELARVLVHGVLHLCGYRDETEEEEMTMRRKEDDALALLLPKTHS